MRHYPYDEDEEIETDDEDESEEDDEDSEDDDEEEYDESDDEAPDEESEEEEPDEEQIIADVERAFRSERARVRACESLVELRDIRATYEDAAANLSHVAQRIRARDLVEIADDRITSLKAARLARRGR